MGSENNMNDATSFQQQSDKPILCATGCGFFGTAAMMNLCSKCYRDNHLKEEQAASAKAAVEKSMSSISPPPVTLVVEKKPVEATEDVVVAEDLVVAEAAAAGPSLVVEAAGPSLVVEAAAKPANRCVSCNKKVGVMGFKCRCGSTFCGSHRYAEEHDCTFDFKGAGKDAIAKANPVVKADKVDRF